MVMFHFRMLVILAQMQCCYFEIRKPSIIITNIIFFKIRIGCAED